MGVINVLFYTNFAVFSIFVTLVMTELMGSVLLLWNYEAFKNPVLSYIVPVWEVTGTFGAFWVVTGDLAFPSLLIPVAVILSFPIMLFLILFVARNSTISFAEFLTKRGWLDEEKLYKGYALASLALGVVVLVVLAALIGGNGINIERGTFSATSWMIHPDGVLFTTGALALLAGLAPIFYGIGSMRRASILIVVTGVIVSTISFEMFKNWHLTYFFVLPDLLVVALPLIFSFRLTSKIASNKLFFIALVSVSTFLLNFMAYPSILGGAISTDSVTNAGPVASSFVPITIGGSVIIGVLIALYSYAVYRKGRAKNEKRFITDL